MVFLHGDILMCKVTSAGYEMKDGTLIPFDANISDIKPEYIAALNEDSSTAWDSFILHREILELKNMILDNRNQVMNKLDSMSHKHLNQVAETKTEIIDFVEGRMNEKIKDQIKQHTNLARSVLRDVLLIASTIGAVVGASKIFGL